MKYLCDLTKNQDAIDAFFRLRGIDEFDQEVIVGRGEYEGTWIDSEIVSEVKKTLSLNDLIVHADYDTDGVSSAAIAIAYNNNTKVIIPKRSWGYGLSSTSMSHIPNGSSLMTADCGVSNEKEIEELQKRGVRVVVTDHHELPVNMPQCMIVHPKLLNHSGFYGYSGSGVIYKLLRGLYNSKNSSALQFAAIGTITDMMPMLDENRLIVRNGIASIQQEPDFRIQALLCSLGKKHKYIDAKDIAFYVGPAINSCSRIDKVDVIEEWLHSQNYTKAKSASDAVNNVNQERKKNCI